MKTPKTFRSIAASLAAAFAMQRPAQSVEAFYTATPITLLVGADGAPFDAPALR